MKGFNFEKHLPHQENAVKSTIAVFEDLATQTLTGAVQSYENPVLDSQSSSYEQNIFAIRARNQIIEGEINAQNNIIDIMMETGTGKTYTYTKTIFELNKQFGIFKFIIVVPTLSIKAGTITFLKSDSCREHFKEQYGKSIHLHVVESQKSSKPKKSFIPPAIAGFVGAGNFEKNSIQVMVINAGMVNSDTLQKSFDRQLLDKYAVPFEAIAAVKPFVIIDEPHKFGQGNKTWGNIQKMKPQFILRYGATFQTYSNLIYALTAVEAFNKNLVKGVVGHITAFESGKNALVKLISLDGREAIFELTENSTQKSIALAKNESLAKIHPAISNLFIENMNKSVVILSNGLEMKKGDKLNPYSYTQTLQELMLQKAIQHHFEIEQQLLAQEVKIKPLTLFFIDNIEEYRNKDGYIRKTLEQLIKAEVTRLLKTETHTFYQSYLETALQDCSKTHAGYFSKDNTEKDEAIEKEINEILHDKQAMLSLENPRRFIFSKWTLREGWDNPNVFQICKLRSSGSEISKLQEVGRGLRLPVNEYGNRVKDEPFFLHYFVDFTESDFVESLVSEINNRSKVNSMDSTSEKLAANKVRKVIESDEERSSSAEQFGKKLNEKIMNEIFIWKYPFENEVAFQKLLTNFLIEVQNKLIKNEVKERVATIKIENKQAMMIESEYYSSQQISVNTMKYSDFLKELSQVLHANIKTLHQSFIDSKININPYLNVATIRVIKENFDSFLLPNITNNTIFT